MTGLDRSIRNFAATGNLAAFAVVLALILAFPIMTANPNMLGIGILVLLYAVLGQAWNILGGYAGQVSLGNAIYFGVGAYVSTLLYVNWGINPWLGMIAGGILSLLFALIVGLPTFRLSGHYFVTATLVINYIVQVVFNNWRWVGGASGLSINDFRDGLLAFQFQHSKVPYYFIIATLYVVTLLVNWLIERGKLGYYFRAIRGDEAAAASLGVHTSLYKHLANSINAVISAFAGTFYAQYVLFVDPPSVFSIWVSVIVLIVPVLGGIGTLWGPFLGAVVLIPLSEVTRILLGGQGRALYLVIYGLLIMIISVAEPRGLIEIIRRLRRIHIRWMAKQ